LSNKIAAMDCKFHQRPQAAAEFDEIRRLNGQQVVPAQMAIPESGFPGYGGHHGWL
jgi:hypothetical protein